MSSKAKSGREALANRLEQLRLEGLEAAYRRGIRMLNDDETPATAQATLVRIFFQAAGLTGADAEAPEKEPHEMTAEELAQEIAQLTKREIGNGGVFD